MGIESYMLDITGSKQNVLSRDTVDQTSLWELAVAVRPVADDSLGRTGVPYHVTTQFYYYSTQIDKEAANELILPIMLLVHASAKRRYFLHGLKIPERTLLFKTIISGLFYCDISDHLPNFISIKHNRTCCKDERPMTRLFGEKNTASFVQRMETENWNDIYTGDCDYYSKFIIVVLRLYQQSFPIVRVSRKRWQDKPWMSKALKTSIKRKNKLYKACIVQPDNSIHNKYKTYKNILRKCLK